MATRRYVRRSWPLLATVVGLLAVGSGSRSSCIPIEPEPGACVENADCLEADAFCAKAVGDCEDEGVCQERPAGCLTVWMPVCGCDGQTYGNECAAHAAGVNVAAQGECLLPVEECVTNEDCGLAPDTTDVPVSRFCQKLSGDCRGAGVCVVPPQVCPDLWAPVCGCDGQTYASACVAHGNATNVAYEGECGPPVEGCTSNADCATDRSASTAALFCQKGTGDCDGTGVCTVSPQTCPMVWSPVCGCDGATYGNACSAHGSRVNVAYPGECEGRAR